MSCHWSPWWLATCAHDCAAQARQLHTRLVLLHWLTNDEQSTQRQQEKLSQYRPADSAFSERWHLATIDEQLIWLAAISALACALPSLQALTSDLAQPEAQAELVLWSASCPCLMAAKMRLPAAQRSLLTTALVQARPLFLPPAGSCCLDMHALHTADCCQLKAQNTSLTAAEAQGGRAALAGQAGRITCASSRWLDAFWEELKAGGPAHRAAEADGIAAQLLQEEAAEQQARSAAQARRKQRKQVSVNRAAKAPLPLNLLTATRAES